MDKNKVLPLQHVTNISRASTVLDPEMYNGLVDYANETQIFNMSTVLRQAAAFFLESKTSKDKKGIKK